MPALFVGHGNPMNAIEDNAFRRGWAEVAKRISRPKAVLCISAHWETEGVFVTGTQSPETIHDFFGFPQALFDVRYPAPGDPALARRTADLLADHDARIDPDRGLDHGAWSVLAAMYPDADIPVVQLSLDSRRPGAFHYALGQRLSPLREEGVLVLGSGDIVHNLRYFRQGIQGALDWAQRANDELKRRIEARDHAALCGFESLGADILEAIPTPEHYLPLLYILALQRDGETVQYFNDEVVHGAVSMTSFIVAERVG